MPENFSSRKPFNRLASRLLNQSSEYFHGAHNSVFPSVKICNLAQAQPWANFQGQETTQKLIKYFFELEQKLDQRAFTLNEMPAWPVFRYALWMLLHFASHNGAPRSCYSTGVTSRGAQAGLLAGATDISKMQEQAVDFLFIANPNSPDRIKTSDQYENRMLDPILELLQPNHSVKKIALLHTNKHLNLISDYLIPVEPILYKKRNARFIYADVDFQISNENIVIIKTMFKELGISIRDRFFQQAANDFIYLKDIYAKILDNFKPKAVFFITLGGNMPLCWAAAEKNIKTIELQHGHIRSQTVIYNSPLRPRGSIYKMLPDQMLVWSEWDKDHINNQFSGLIKATVSGYPWLTSKLDLEDKTSIQVLQEIRQRHDFVILFALQDQHKIPDFVHSLIDNNDQKIGWIIKKHPRYATSLPLHLGKNVYVDETLDKLPVIEILKNCDALLSQYSAAFYEADQIGLPCFIYDRVGEQTFPNEVKTGLIQLITKDWTSDRLLSAISAKHSNKGASSMIARNVNTHHLVKEIVN